MSSSLVKFIHVMALGYFIGFAINSFIYLLAGLRILVYISVARAILFAILAEKARLQSQKG